MSNGDPTTDPDALIQFTKDVVKPYADFMKKLEADGRITKKEMLEVAAAAGAQFDRITTRYRPKG